MSRFFSEKYKNLVPYVPGEQPQEIKYLKLNTNESPFPPSKGVAEAVAAEAERLQLYSDPDSKELTAKIAEVYGVKPSQVVVTNGSDEVLNFAFMAFADEKRPLAFPNITYGFYTVFADINHIPYTEIPLRCDFTINPEDYTGINKNIVIPNPNAPSGYELPLTDIEKMVASNPDNLVIIDEAYVDFGAESAVPLINKYDNLFVTQTFSKSRSMAGARLGFGIASEELISDINTIRYSTNPYNINRMTAAAGYAALCDNDYYMKNCRIIEENREQAASELKKLGFTVLPSKANFIFVKSERISGEKLYTELKKRGILIRHFDKEIIRDYNRITIGTQAQMEKLVQTVKEILEEQEG